MTKPIDLQKHRHRKLANESLPSLDSVVAALKSHLYCSFRCPAEFDREGRRLGREASKAIGRTVRSLRRSDGSLYIYVDDRTEQEEMRIDRLVADVIQARMSGKPVSPQGAVAAGDLKAHARRLGVTVAYAERYLERLSRSTPIN